MILLDTSGILSALDASEPRHRASRAALLASEAPRLLSPFVLAEVDYLLTTRVSATVAHTFLSEVASGAYQLERFDSNDIAEAGDILDRYASLTLGLADASIVVLARRHATVDLLTLDERHFRAVAATGRRPFRILPADGPR